MNRLSSITSKNRPETSTPLFEKLRLPGISNLGKVLALAAALCPYYLVTHRNRDNTVGDYPLPESITVKETSLPSSLKMVVTQVPKSTTFPSGFRTNEIRVLETKDIDFSKDFKIVTDRYTYDKHEDWAPSTWIGQIVSSFTKLFFMDYKMGAGLDAKEAKVVLSMLETKAPLANSYVRVNHNEVFHDLGRLFKDPKVVARNNLAARILIGLPTTFFGELFAELRRGDYYNPMTQTAVLYSNVRSVAAHELGHHQDFQRFSSDWWYSAGRAVPPVMIYQEWRASANAKDSILSQSDSWQFYRYLMPAFLTYLIAAYSISKKKLTAEVKKELPWREYEITAGHIVKDCATAHGSFWTGIGASHAAIAAGAHPVLGAAVLLGTWIACKVVAKKVLEDVAPLPYEPKQWDPLAALRNIQKKRRRTYQSYS